MHFYQAFVHCWSVAFTRNFDWSLWSYELIASEMAYIYGVLIVQRRRGGQDVKYLGIPKGLIKLLIISYKGFCESLVTQFRHYFFIGPNSNPYGTKGYWETELSTFSRLNTLWDVASI